MDLVVVKIIIITIIVRVMILVEREQQKGIAYWRMVIMMIICMVVDIMV